MGRIADAIYKIAYLVPKKWSFVDTDQLWCGKNRENSLDEVAVQSYQTVGLSVRDELIVFRGKLGFFPSSFMWQTISQLARIPNRTSSQHRVFQVGGY